MYIYICWVQMFLLVTFVFLPAAALTRVLPQTLSFVRGIVTEPIMQLWFWAPAGYGVRFHPTAHKTSWIDDKCSSLQRGQFKRNVLFYTFIFLKGLHVFV